MTCPAPSCHRFKTPMALFPSNIDVKNTRTTEHTVKTHYYIHRETQTHLTPTQPLWLSREGGDRDTCHSPGDYEARRRDLIGFDPRSSRRAAASCPSHPRAGELSALRRRPFGINTTHHLHSTLPAVLENNIQQHLPICYPHSRFTPIRKRTRFVRSKKKKFFPDYLLNFGGDRTNPNNRSPLPGCSQRNKITPPFSSTQASDAKQVLWSFTSRNASAHAHHQVRWEL